MFYKIKSPILKEFWSGSGEVMVYRVLAEGNFVILSKDTSNLKIVRNYTSRSGLTGEVIYKRTDDDTNQYVYVSSFRPQIDTVEPDGRYATIYLPEENYHPIGPIGTWPPFYVRWNDHYIVVVGSMDNENVDRILLPNFSCTGLKNIMKPISILSTDQILIAKVYIPLLQIRNSIRFILSLLKSFKVVVYRERIKFIANVRKISKIDLDSGDKKIIVEAEIRDYEEEEDWRERVESERKILLGTNLFYLKDLLDRFPFSDIVQIGGMEFERIYVNFINRYSIYVALGLEKFGIYNNLIQNYVENKEEEYYGSK